MTAPLSVSRPEVSRDAASPATRVVSVSPRAAEVSSSSGTAARRRTSSAFITPRVIDQAAFDDLSMRLRALIDDAAEAGRNIAAQVAMIEGGQHGAKKAGTELQERLQLGARMLGAFQSQIVRIEESLAELDRRDRLARATPLPGAVADEALVRFRSQLDELMQRAMAEMEARMTSVQAAADETSMHLAGMLRSVAVCIEGEVGHRSAPAELSGGAD